MSEREQVSGVPEQEGGEKDAATTAADEGAERNEDSRSAAEQDFEQNRDEEDSKEEEDEGKAEGVEGVGSSAEDELARLAMAFFTATTKASTDNEDILPQEDSDVMKLSVFSVFAGLFPEAVGEHGAGVKNKRLRLHFNKIGYQIYSKEQSRRVPAVRAKPGNPGYGFRRARWRDTTLQESDREHCIKVLREVGCSEERISAVLHKVQGTCLVWDSIRRPSRPAGPGRPRRPEDGSTSSPVIKPASPKLEVSAAKFPKSSWSKKSGSEKRAGDAKSCASSAPKASSTCVKRKARGSGGGKSRKESADLRDETVPNLVKDEASESEVLWSSARGMSQSPHLSFTPLDPGLRVAAGGSQSIHSNYKTYDAGRTGGQRTEGAVREEGRGMRQEACKQPQTQPSATQNEGTATGPSATKRACHASQARSDPKGSKRLKTQDARADQRQDQGLHRDDPSLLPPLKLGDAIMSSACAATDPRRTLPSLAHLNAHSFSGLERLASLASEREKLVAGPRTPSSGMPACAAAEMADLDSIPNI